MSIPLSRRFLRLLTFRWPRPAAIAFCGVLGTILPAAVGLSSGIADPSVHDEFSYLLNADTFAHGRVTNPPPALPEFFEAPHVLVVPTYNSKYPPGQGLALAVGQAVGGHPIWGVWVSCGLFAASLCWMLQAWTSREWAVAMTLVPIATVGMFSYWAQSYWGGMVAACGGALLFGAMRRTCQSPHAWTSVLLGLGVLVLANTRPYEGLLVCIPAAAVLWWWFTQDRRTPQRAKVTSWLLPLGTVLLVGGCAMSAYNRAVTGEWLLMPYSAHTRQYFHHGLFLFSTTHEPERTPAPRVARFYRVNQATPEHGWGLLARVASNLSVQFPTTIESVLGVPNPVEWIPVGVGSLRETRVLILVGTLALVMILADPWVWFCVITTVVVVLGESLVWWWFPHYAAPVLPLLLAAGAQTLRRGALELKAVSYLPATMPAAVCLSAALSASAPILPTFFVGRDAEVEVIPDRSDVGDLSRSEVTRRLERQGGSHLVFVQYSDDFSPDDEWVYNLSDLTAPGVIFAHDLGSTKNSALIDAYPHRTIWIVTLSPSERQLRRYSNGRARPYP